jgi:hypothetical protein
MGSLLVRGPHEDIGAFCARQIDGQPVKSHAAHVAELRRRGRYELDALRDCEQSGPLRRVSEHPYHDLVEDLRGLTDDGNVASMNRVE